jgi:serine protease inhibitor
MKTRSRKLVFLIFFVLLMNVGCGQQLDSQAGQVTGSDQSQNTSTIEYSLQDIDSRVRDANFRFGFNLYRQLLKEEEGKNVFISPSSVAIALAMTYNGASGVTQEAMAKALVLEGINLEDVNKANAALKAVLENADPSVQLSIANSLWSREGYDFKEEFIRRNKEFYDAEVTALDFDKDSSVETINEWVKEKTKGKIEEIVEGPIDPLTILFLINAIYFNGDWANEFDKSRTFEDNFYLEDGTTINHPLMRQTGQFNYYKNERFQSVSLPYGNGKYSMYVFLPHENSSLEEIHQQLNAENWQDWMFEYREAEGVISLPRFELEYEIGLNDALKALGMEVAFSESEANFENMVNIPPNAYIKDVLHKTFIKVNEEGTEAAAVTKVEVATESMPAYDFEMIVNRPFFFAIRDNETESVLFMGSIVNPQ